MKTQPSIFTSYRGIPLEIRRSQRKSISMEVTPQLSLLVRVPLRMSQTRIRAFLDEKSDWILKTMKIVQEKERQREEHAVPALSEDEMTKLRENARRDLTRRCAYWAPQVGVTYGRIAIRMQMSPSHKVVALF